MSFEISRSFSWLVPTLLLKSSIRLQQYKSAKIMRKSTRYGKPSDVLLVGIFLPLILMIAIRNRWQIAHKFWKALLFHSNMITYMWCVTPWGKIYALSEQSIWSNVLFFSRSIQINSSLSKFVADKMIKQIENKKTRT